MFLVLLTFVCLSLAQYIPDRCSALEEFTGGVWEEEWMFDNWQKQQVFVAQETTGVMAGNWTYEISFCDSVKIYRGDITKDTTNNTFGWTYGFLSSFVRIESDIPYVPPSPSSFSIKKDQFSSSIPAGVVEQENPQPATPPIIGHIALLSFVQKYSSGDKGAPCVGNSSRSSTVNIYCGVNISQANCTALPNSNGRAACLVGNPNDEKDFCVCSVLFNATMGVCTGLVFNVLSNICPSGRAIEIIPPVSPMIPISTGTAVAIAVAVILATIVTLHLAGTCFNLISGRRGLDALPCYTTCCGRRQYLSVPVPTYASPSVPTFQGST